MIDIKESEKRIKELYMYDVLRADRCISENSLEARVPFGDIEFVEYVMSIDPKLKMNVYNKGKSDGKSEAWTFKASYENKTALTFSVTSGYYIVVTQLGQTSYCTISTSGASVTVVTEIKALKIYKATSTGNLSLNGNGKNLNILVYCGIS